MLLNKRYCVEYVDGTIECFRDGFWYSETGLIVKWAILAGIFLFFTAWFLGGYLHAKQRMKKGKPLLGYHRWLVSYQDRKKYSQTPQNQFSFYQAQPYGQPYHPQHQQSAEGTWPEPPPMYTAGKEGQAVEMPYYGAPPPMDQHYGPPPGAPPVAMGQQQTGVVGEHGGLESQTAPLPPRPERVAAKNFLGRFRK